MLARVVTRRGLSIQPSKSRSMYRHVIPPRAIPRTDEKYFEVLTQAVFQAGFSWQVVRAKWPHFSTAFKGFKIPTVARFGYRDIQRLLANPRLIRNARKIQATMDNAQTLEDLSRRFRYLGPTGVFFFLWCVGEDVPEWKDRRPKD